jgi:hypothetical protein
VHDDTEANNDDDEDDDEDEVEGGTLLRFACFCSTTAAHTPFDLHRTSTCKKLAVVMRTTKCAPAGVVLPPPPLPPPAPLPVDDDDDDDNAGP